MITEKSQDILLWTLDLGGRESTPAAWLDLLDESERLRCRRFVRAQDGLSYAAAHALLRQALGGILGLAPAAVKIVQDALEKPTVVADGAKDLDFSLSHTEGLVAVAACSSGRIGVDVEAVNRRVVPREDYAAFGLSAEETALMTSLSEPERSEAFLGLWTAREAVAKADGRGLSLPFGRIRLDSTGSSAGIFEDGCVLRRYRLWRERPSPRHLLALAGPENGTLIRREALI